MKYGYNAKSGKNRGDGWILTEIFVTIAILVLLTGVITAGVNASRKSNHYHYARQQCIAAGAAQLEAITIAGQELNPAEIEGLWPGITVTVTESTGGGEWENMRLLQVDAQMQTLGRTVSVSQRRYLAVKELK